MDLFIIARFHAREGEQDTAAAAMRDMVGPTRAEPGCLAIETFRSIRDPRLFFVHSRWLDEPAFDFHASLPHTLLFIERMTACIDHPLDVARVRPLGAPDRPPQANPDS